MGDCLIMNEFQPQPCVYGKLEECSFAYSGELEVQGGEFTLDADRLIVRNDGVAFKLSGVDRYFGSFKTTGTALHTTNGTYVANDIKIHYDMFSGDDDYATIQFSVVRQTSKKLRCYIEGKWIEGKDVWTFSGNLKKYKQKQN